MIMSSTSLAVSAAEAYRYTKKQNNSPKAPGASKCCNGQNCEKCIRRKKFIRSYNLNLKPQFGFIAPGGNNILGALKAVAALRGINLPRESVNVIEGLVALYFALRDCTTRSQFVATVILYLRGHTSEGVLLSLTEYLEGLTGLKPQSSDSNDPKWLEDMKDLQHNWTRAINGEGFELVSRVISLCLALGMCNVSKYQFSMGGIRLFSVEAFKKHCTAIDLADACFATVVFFVEGGYQCFCTGSLKPLLFGGFSMENFEENYAKCHEWYELTRSGNLQRIANVSENDFEKLLCDTIESARDMVRTAKGPIEKNILSRKMDSLLSLRANFRQTRVQGGIRVAPYCIGLFGGSGVGKSFLTQVLMTLTLKANGYNADPERIITVNESDKFMSNYRSYVNGIIIDDLGNTKAEFVEHAPTAKVVEVVNNVRAYANMAEADMKGKVSIEPYVTIITKNVKDSCASTYSNEPASITRRENITITVNVREEYATNSMLDSEKVARAFPDGPPLVGDLWTFTVQRSFPMPNEVRNKAATVGWETLHWNSKALQDITIHELIDFITHDSRCHFKNQTVLVENTNTLHDKLSMCDVCNFPSLICKCKHESDDDDLSMQFGFNPIAIADSLRVDNEIKPRQPGFYFWERVFDFISYTPFGKQRFAPIQFLHDLELVATDKLVSDLRSLENNDWWSWMAFVPGYFMTDSRCKYILETMSYSDFEKHRRKHVNKVLINFVLCTIISVLLGGSIGAMLFLFVSVRTIISLAERNACAKAALYAEINRRRDALPTALKHYRENHSQYILGSCAALAGIYLLAQGWKALRCVPETQGNLAPTSMKDIEDRDAESNPWAQAMVAPLPCAEEARTSVHEDIKHKVQKNLCYMTIEHEKGRIFCDAFFPCSNVALIPQHIWKSDDMMATFHRHSPNVIGGNFKAILSKATSYFIPGTDLCLTWVPSGGDWADLRKFFVTGPMVTCPATMVYRDANANIIEMKMIMQPGTVRSTMGNYAGCNYILTQDTFDGLCMAVCITNTKGSCIGGFHLAGKEGSRRGASGSLTRSQLDHALQKLREVPCVLLSTNSGTLPTEVYGKKFYKDSTIHPKSPINFLPIGSNIKYYGQVDGRATYHSSVTTLPISDLVEKHCGVPNKWGKPKFHEGYPWQASLQYSANPSIGLPGHLLNRAKEDYVRGIVDKLKTLPDLVASITPLSEIDVVCGKDGVRFIDKMPAGTSVGYPLGGPKRDYLTDLDPKEVTSHSSPAELHKQFWDEAYRIESVYLAGERAYPIFKACLKDEPTLLTKTKVRVFQGAPIAFQLLIRKYYLPVLRAISLCPLVSECAVGVNAHGPEWEQLCSHMTKFGKDRILAGDYSKYDLRMPAQVTFVSLRCFIDIARFCGYSDHDLIIMEGIASDLAYPLTAYNGDLIQLMGSTASGSNITVYINNTDNGILQRCHFFDVYPNAKDFRAACAVCDYGDDFKGSVHKDYSEFNHISFAKFLKKYDMVLTMPDKESTPTEYMKDEDADFLKRKNVFVPELGLHLGALDEDSIFKSLHSVLTSSAVTTHQQAMSNIDGALREWFAHGRDVYEMRQRQMRAIANEADIAYGCSMLSTPYEQLVNEFKERYLNTVPELGSL